MDLFKLDKYDKYFIAFILVLITLFDIGQCFATDLEEVTTQTVANLGISQNSNAFVSSSDGLTYFEVEKGYIYYITLEVESAPRLIAVSSTTPQLYGEYTYLGAIDNENNTFSYVSYSNSYVYVSFTPKNSESSGQMRLSVKREKIAGQASAVDDLVENVGVNQLWGVFEGGIDFVGVIVLVAFGLFLVFLLIKKLSKGKADF